MSKTNIGICFERCYPIEEHAKQVMEWRNDPITLSMFYHHEPKIWSKFWNEFRDTYFAHRQETNPVFAVLGGKRVGFLKFSQVKHPGGLQGLTVDISINIAPDSRGKGLGTKVLKACVEYLCSKGVDSIYAEVLSHNMASIKTFKAAGFSFIGKKEKVIVDTGETHLIECFLLDMVASNYLGQGLSCDDITN